MSRKYRRRRKRNTELLSNIKDRMVNGDNLNVKVSLKEKGFDNLLVGFFVFPRILRDAICFVPLQLGVIT